MPETTDATATSSTATGELTGAPPSLDHEAPLPEGTKAETAERFKALLDDRKSMKERLAGYEAYGSPEEIAALRARVQNLDALQDRVERMEARREEGAPKSDAQKETEQQIALARKQLRSLDPAIEDGGWAAALLREEMLGLEQEASEAQRALMKTAGVEATPENMDLYGNFIAATIKASTKLKRLYRQNPEAAVQAGWKELQARFTTGSPRAAEVKAQDGKEKLASLPKPHGGGGGPGPSPGAGGSPPTTSAEGVKRALAILRG